MKQIGIINKYHNSVEKFGSPNRTLSGKRNRIKIGKEMEEKQHFLIWAHMNKHTDKDTHTYGVAQS